MNGTGSKVCSTECATPTAGCNECSNGQCTGRCEPTFASKQLPRQIQSHYRGERRLHQIDRVIAEQPDGQSTIVIEFKDNYDEWEWKQTGANWSSWVKARSALPYEND